MAAGGLWLTAIAPRPASLVTIVLRGALSLWGRSLAEDVSGTCTLRAEVVDLSSGVEARYAGKAPRLLAAGDIVETGAELVLPARGRLVLAMSDGTVRRFDGPTTILLDAAGEKTRGSVVAKIGSDVVSLLFSRKADEGKAVMATRGAAWGDGLKSIVPVIVHPAPSSVVFEGPREFRWRAVDGVGLYRVSVYSTERMLWQANTSVTAIACPPDRCDFLPGETYYWVVEALLENACLRSQTAEFRILSEEDRGTLASALGELDSSLDDRALANTLKVRLCLASGLYSKALDLIDSFYGQADLDRRGHQLRAQAFEEMGLLDTACLEYKQALAQPGSQ
jgi:hypothetical protein